MTGLIAAHFIETREQLQKALGATLRAERLDVGAFDLFRRRLLQQIAEEERVILPALTSCLGGPPLYRAALRQDHAGLATLCAPLPERESVENLRDLFAQHSAVEEAAGGLYEMADRLLGARAATVLAGARALPQVKLTPFGGPWARELLSEVLRAAGLAPSTG